MGSIRVRRGNPRPYQGRVYNPDGRLVSRSFRTKSDAKKWIKSKEREVDEGRYIDHRSGDKTFGEYASAWISDRSHMAPGTIERDASYLNAQILPVLGSRRIRTITSTEIASWIAQLDLADSTKSKIVQITAGVMEYARRDRAIAYNPAKDLPRRTAQRPARHGRALDDSELAALLTASNQVGQGLAVCVMARLGLRVGEALGLRAGDLDSSRRLLSVQRSRDKQDNVRPLKGRQSGNMRVVPVPADVAVSFSRHIDEMEAIPISGDLFVTTKRTPLVYRNWRRQFWMPTVELAAVANVTPHDLRRTCVTRLFVVDRWTPAEVQAFVGHADARTTLDIYAKVNTETLPTPSTFEAQAN